MNWYSAADGFRTGDGSYEYTEVVKKKGIGKFQVKNQGYRIHKHRKKKELKDRK